jgi:hypothetical protein
MASGWPGKGHGALLKNILGGGQERHELLEIGKDILALLLALLHKVRGREILRSPYTKTCIAPASSITDHRRLMYVAILAQLSKHEVRHVLPRYSGGFVRISAEKDLVLTRGTLVSDPGWAHDHPL